MIELTAGTARATVLPDAGGRVGSLTVDGTALLVTDRPGAGTTMWGSFPMAPWVGRLRNGRFTHDGTTYQVERNLPPHAIHGTAFVQPWSVIDVQRTNATIRCDLGPGWPLGGIAEQRFELAPDALTCTLRVVAAEHSMPAEVGWHPWLAVTGPVTLHATVMYERGPDHLPTGRLIEPLPRPWDDCFLATQPVTMPVGPFVITVTSDCDHLVVFDELDAAVAVEPQSGPPDAFNLRPRVLRPHEALERTMSITWAPRQLSGVTDAERPSHRKVG